MLEIFEQGGVPCDEAVSARDSIRHHQVALLFAGSVMLTVLIGPAVATANGETRSGSPTHEETRVDEPRKTVVNFNEDKIDGDLTRPSPSCRQGMLLRDYVFIHIPQKLRNRVLSSVPGL